MKIIYISNAHLQNDFWDIFLLATRSLSNTGYAKLSCGAILITKNTYALHLVLWIHVFRALTFFSFFIRIIIGSFYCQKSEQHIYKLVGTYLYTKIKNIIYRKFENKKTTEDDMGVFTASTYKFPTNFFFCEFVREIYKWGLQSEWTSPSMLGLCHTKSNCDHSKSSLHMHLKTIINTSHHSKRLIYTPSLPPKQRVHLNLRCPKWRVCFFFGA